MQTTTAPIGVTSSSRLENFNWQFLFFWLMYFVLLATIGYLLRAYCLS
jgi:hypothetical protein